MSRIIASTILCCISLITAALRTHLIPQQIPEVDALAKASETSTVLSAFSSTTAAKSSGQLECIEDECKLRISTNLEVHSYDLEYIYTHMNETTARGSVIIDFTLKEPTNQLIYHGKRMIQLDKPALYEDGVLRLVTMRIYPPNDYISLRIAPNNSVFKPNRYRLKQTFVVSLIDGNVGFYQSLYNDGNRTVG